MMEVIGTGFWALVGVRLGELALAILVWAALTAPAAIYLLVEWIRERRDKRASTGEAERRRAAGKEKR